MFGTISPLPLSDNDYGCKVLSGMMCYILSPLIDDIIEHG